ncbi:MAG: 30S ribosomal protein S2 [Marinilabiliales bacterium]|nr:MAG: 30S ribosomal protein S2 [Marinilabiliales bacterium]
MANIKFEQLLDAGCHFGHLKRKWNPNMAPYIFMEQNGIHIIDLYKTIAKMQEAGDAMKQIAKSGKKILFVGTKKQSKEIVAEVARKINMPYVTERWPGGMLTNFVTIRKAVKKMAHIDKMLNDPTFASISKRERLQITRERAKLDKTLGSIADLNKLPSALFVVDISKEHIAVAEAQILNIPTFAIVDTNSDPKKVDFPIPANDDAAKSISLILNTLAEDVQEGLNERKMQKDKAEEEEAPKAEVKEEVKEEVKAEAAEEVKEEKVEAPEEKKEAAPKKKINIDVNED